MWKFFKSTLKRILYLVFSKIHVELHEMRNKLYIELDEVKINQGKILLHCNNEKLSKKLQDYEFKIFSQWGEDGIIQHLIANIEIKNKTFIEFGVEDFSEANCRFLMMNNNWEGLVIDSSDQNINRLKQSYYYSKYGLIAVCAFITKENINNLLSIGEFHTDLGILSIDLDGNDYHILESIKNFKPRIIICEFNAVFGSERKISVPYDEKFNRTEKHFSNLYFGASLAAITSLAERKGYSLVGINSNSVNAFFVRKDVLSDKIEALSAKDAYTPSLFRESRDKNGAFSFIGRNERLETIKGLPVMNVETNEIENL